MSHGNFFPAGILCGHSRPHATLSFHSTIQSCGFRIKQTPYVRSKSTVLWCYCVTVLRFYCITVLLYYCFTVLLCYCITVLVYYCFTVLLCYCITVFTVETRYNDTGLYDNSSKALANLWYRLIHHRQP
jgi:hypothetical protein